MIVILAALGLFKRMVKNTVDARTDAQSNAQRNAGFLAAGLQLQSAGFGIENAAWGTHVLVVENALWNEESKKIDGSSDSNDSGNAIIWVKNINGSTTCSALWAPKKSGEMYLLESAACNSVLDWKISSWDKSIYLKRSNNLIKDEKFDMTITKTTGPCSPYGVNKEEELTSEAEEPIQQIQKAIIDFMSVSSTGNSIRSRVCLPNISAS